MNINTIEEVAERMLLRMLFFLLDRKARRRLESVLDEIWEEKGFKEPRNMKEALTFIEKAQQGAKEVVEEFKKRYGKGLREKHIELLEEEWDKVRRNMEFRIYQKRVRKC